MALIDGDDRLAGGLDSVAGTRRFWIGVASRDHVNVGVERAFIQLNHGKDASLRRLKAGDAVIMYSPRTTYPMANRFPARDFALIAERMGAVSPLWTSKLISCASEGRR